MEGVVLEGYRLAVALHEADVSQIPPVNALTPAYLEHLAVYIVDDDMPLRPDPVGHEYRYIARAAGHVYGALPGVQAGLFGYEPLPDAVSAHAHQVVHQVVPGGDGVENLPDLTLFFLLGYQCLPEVGHLLFDHIHLISGGAPPPVFFHFL